MEELGFHQVSPTIIYEDNNDCIALGIVDTSKTVRVISICVTELHVSNRIDTAPIP